MAYNPYSAIDGIYNAKIEWDKANKAGDEAGKSKAHENALVYYDQLRNNGYGAVADELNAVDATGAKSLRDQYSTKNSGYDNVGYSTSMQSASDKNNTLAGYIDSDRNDVHGKYNDIFNYANQDITKTDEYKSTYDNLMKKYDMSALQGRDNAAASGAASNGGNIDSYAAANAMRQQASITAQGQQVAHQAGLDAYNSRISNVTKILSDLGVYNSGTYDAMNQTIENDRNIANDYFNNAETAKNNEVARLSEQASVTGVVPNKWSYENNIYLNADGTVRDEFMTAEFDATGGFTTIINEAKAKLAKTTDPTERANLQATIDAATQAKALKTFSRPEYAKYAHEVQAVSGAPTQSRREFEMQDATSRAALETEENINTADNQTQKEINEANNKNTLDQIETTAKYTQTEGDDYAAYDTLLKMFDVNETRKRAFIEEHIKPIYEGKEVVTPETLKQLILTNSAKYNIDVDDARIICKAFDVDTSWLDGYRDRTDADGALEDGTEGRYGGMVQK